MELGLSLGDTPKPFGFLEKAPDIANRALPFCMGLSIGPNFTQQDEDAAADGDKESQEDDDDDENDTTTTKAKKQSLLDFEKITSMDPVPIQLDLLPNTPVPRYSPSLHRPSDHIGSSEVGCSGQMARGFDVNKFPVADELLGEDGGGSHALSSSPNSNSPASSFQMDFCIYSGGSHKRDFESAAGSELEAERGSSRASDEDENGCTRKKLRLSKEQSAFLEESFKEHNTLNPKQKLALAKQLNLRPRQVEVWFQNRRARTKLKQTEVDCEYLKRCCETLTEENRRLHKELQELRALKTSNPFYMQLPATTLTMCPSCERVATTTTTPPATATAAAIGTGSVSKPSGFPLITRPGFYPFSQTQSHTHQPTTSREMVKHTDK